ncbi:MAG: DNA-binding response regulator [Candidatus Hydrogenedentota bacterium]|nr:MAG: DNA-binding response regulator [Candidatus Hydrogenedentota bacterium]
MRKKTRILIADDHAMFRAGLKAYLESEEGFEVVAECGNAEEIDRLLPKKKPDVVLLDIRMPGPPVTETVRLIKKTRAQALVIVLTMHEEERYLREVFQAGADGFVLKKSSASQLITALETIRSGQKYIDPALSDLMVSSMISPSQSSPEKSSPLSPRETEVLKLIARGYTNQQIADELFISKRTVDTHRANIQSKLGVKTRAELVDYALARNLLTEE